MFTVRTLLAQLFLIYLTFFSAASLAAEQQYNIVFILADNQSSEAIGAYGNQDVKTPIIDELARRGVQFNNAFAVSGMCSPTRATLLTGLIPSQHGLHAALHDDWVDQLDSGWSAIQEFRTVPATLAQQGYQTAMVGKWHIGDPKTAQAGYQHWVALPYGHTINFWDNQLVVNEERVEVRDQHIVDVLGDYAANYILEVDTTKPFFLQLSLDGPYALPPTNYGPARNRHYPGYAEQAFNSMPIEPPNDHILQRIQGPFVPEHAIENGIDDMGLDEIWNSLLYRTLRMQGDRASYANFLSQNTLVDDAVGKVIQALKVRGLSGSTIIIYSADQGNLFGQHGTWGHTNWFSPAHLYDAALKIPLIVYHPDGVNGIQIDELIAQYDLAPTLLALANDTTTEFYNSPGKSFAKLITERLADEIHQAIFFEQEESRGMRTHQYAYWKRADGMGEPELYDISIDRGQVTNIYSEEKNIAVVKQLDLALEDFFSIYVDEEYDLWQGGLPKGTNANPVPWIKAFPLPWLKKFFKDYVIKSEPEPKEPFRYNQ